MFSNKTFVPTTAAAMLLAAAMSAPLQGALVQLNPPAGPVQQSHLAVPDLGSDRKQLFPDGIAVGGGKGLYNLTYRQTLRGCEERKYGNNGSGARMAGMKLMKIRGQIKKAQMKEDWQEINKLAEEGLKINPWDSPLNEIGRAHV